MKKESTDGEFTSKETEISYDDDVCFSLRNNRSEKNEIKNFEQTIDNTKTERNYKVRFTLNSILI